jgi:hypothetical protein
LLRRGAAVGVAGATAWAAPAILTIDRAGAAGSGAGDLATTNGTVEVGQPGVNTLLLTFDITGAGGPFTLANNTDPQLPPETAQMTVAAGCVYFPGGGVAYFAGAPTCGLPDGTRVVRQDHCRWPRRRVVPGPVRGRRDLPERLEGGRRGHRTVRPGDLRDLDGLALARRPHRRPAGMQP